MKTVTERPSFQGELMLRKVDSIPSEVTEAKPEGSVYVVGHSETGHHHVLERSKAQVFDASDNPLMSWIKVQEGAELKHNRADHQHESLYLPPGSYEVRRQREYTPAGWRRAQD